MRKQIYPFKIYFFVEMVVVDVVIFLGVGYGCLTPS